MKNCFRPHQGIILFNTLKTLKFFLNFIIAGFRPHQGIILFNMILSAILFINTFMYWVSVPIRGLFYLTISPIHYE